MARNVQIVLEIDDRGTAKVKQFSRTVKDEAEKAKQNANVAFTEMGRNVAARVDQMTTRFLRWGSVIGGVFGGLAIRSVLKFGTEFEASMSGVRAVTGASAKAMQDLEGQARTLGATTAFTAVEAGTAMEELGKAGFETTEILAVMPDVLNLAGAGMLEMSEAASITSDLMRSLGLETWEFKNATDVVAKTATSAKTTVSELGYAFTDAAPVARSLGIDVVGLNASLGVLANRGFTATRAGTALRRIYSVFLGDLEEGEKGLSKFNLQLFDNEGNFVGLAETVRQFNEQGVTANDIMEAFGLRGGPAMLQIFRAGPEEIEKFEQALRDAAGTAEDVFTERFNNLRGATKELTSALQEVALVFFDKVAPGLTEGADSATELVRAWGEAIKASDVLAGLERIGTALKATFTVLGGVVIVGLMRRMQALVSQAIIPLIAGFDDVTIAVLRSDSFLTAWAAASIGVKAAMVGVAGAAAYMGWKIGRTIGEVTGLDGAMQRFYEHAFDLSDSLKNRSDDLDVNIRSIGRSFERFESFKVPLRFETGTLGSQLQTLFDEVEAAGRKARVSLVDSGKTEEEINKIVTAVKAKKLERLVLKLDVDEETLSAFATRLRMFSKDVKDLSEDDLQTFRKELYEIGGAGVAGFELLSEALGVFRRKQKEEDDALVKRKEEEARLNQQRKDDISKLTGALGKIGVASKQSADEFVTQFNRIVKSVEGAENEAITASDVYRAYGDEIDELVEGFESMGRKVPPALRAIKQTADDMRNAHRIAHDYRTELERFNDSDISVGPLQGTADIFNEIDRVANAWDWLVYLVETHQITPGVAQEEFETLRKQLIELAELSGGMFSSELGSAIPDFDPTLYTTGAEQARDSMLDLARAQAELADVNAEFVATYSSPFSKDRLDAELAALQEHYSAIALENENLKWEELDAAERQGGDLDAIRAKWDAKEITAQQKKELAEDKLRKLSKQQRTKLWLDTASTAVSALDTIFGESKATAIAEAIINTAQGVTRALADPGGPAGYVLAALVAAAGAVQIAKIRSTKKEGAALGGLIEGRRDIEVGEQGVEAIIPLVGPAAARVRDALGLGDLGRQISQLVAAESLRMSAGTPATAPLAAPEISPYGAARSARAEISAAGAAGTTVNVDATLNFYGDNWRDEGLSEEVSAMIRDGVNEVIESGIRPAFSTERV